MSNLGFKKASINSSSTFVFSCFFELNVLLIDNLSCLLFLFVGAQKDVKVAHTEEIDQRENHYDVSVDILSLSESVLFIQKWAQNWTNEFTKASAGDEDARNVIIEFLDVVVAVVSLLNRL